MEREVFLVEDGVHTALFAPLWGLVMEVIEEEKDVIVKLLEQPTFSFKDLFAMFPELEPERLFDHPSMPVAEPDKIFSPTGVTLFTTFDCHLRCVYCYANAGVQKVNMDTKIADAAIDFIIANAQRKGETGCSLEFHGGGEPTRNWQVFQHALLRFKREARVNKLAPKVGLATNGMLSQTQINWIAEHFAEVQVSLDGMEEIQDVQRPTANHGGSFAVVSRTIRAFLAKGIELVLHTVVTERGAERIPEIVRFFADNFPKTTVHIEPAYPCGRGLTTGEQFPLPVRFVEGFWEARSVVQPFGVTLIYSGAGPQLAARNRNFCGVSNPNFVVTPAGLVTACHEVAELTHPLAEVFIYGHFDRVRETFVFNREKIERLRRFAANVDSACEECFARFYCAGDCLVKLMNTRDIPQSPLSNPRCAINRGLMRRYILNQLSDGRKEECDEYAAIRTR